MFEKKNYILLWIVGILLGFIVVQQFYLHKKIVQVTQPDSEKNLALEVSELIKTNFKLNQEVSELNSQHEKLSRSAADAKTANQTLEENLTKYEIISGTVDVEGKGVEIFFDNKIHSTQIIDLLNAIKNIGADAIDINGQRDVINTSLSTGFFNPPVKVSVIGDKDLLYESLVRSGGILEQIGYGKVEKKDNLIIKAK